ncbi:xanthine dehydrogenase small subunit [Lacipirellula limnantheis]|uniref:4-hydroxybenzoyl-CoA reductase subunit gamma n=1 Tax=Lacipirellula limnantheis TaxID=2528024 RepID=A0A517TWZ0_9BACT|nr:FAD binding domain-containing protein [Lacipirellula limnantheis]QDT72887.1 4-hydroxybenzoyl-CoA reductase subunit gamma [Lacipirellula limnantheis]
MRDHLLLFINGQRHEVSGRATFVSLSDYLRLHCGLIGTKIVCSEGDCGACTTLVGRPDFARGEFHYVPIDSCIQFLFQLDGTHVVTVEGLRRDGTLNSVQQAMVDCHGSQCGFCTPGFVMAMTGLLEEQETVDENELRTGLTGNLCRCTGYTPILEAGMKSNDAEHERLNELYPAAPLLAEFETLRNEPLALAAEWFGESHVAACPTTLAGALEFLAQHPTATIVAGATDIGVRINKSGRIPPAILDLNRIAELDHVGVGNEEITVGARATWTDILIAIANAPRVASRGKDHRLRPILSDLAEVNGHEVPEQAAPRRHRQDGLGEFARVIATFGARQIRNVGTIAGNIVNASPIADSLPFLYVMDAFIVIAGKDDMRVININDFYHGYKQTDLKPGELVMGVRIPRPKHDDLLRLYKVSRRRDLDISGFTAAVRMQLEGDAITQASIAFGAVGPTVLRAKQTERFLVGEPLTLETMQTAGDIAVSEVTPIDDVRGSAEYRRQLTRNVLLKFYHQTQGHLAPA